MRKLVTATIFLGLATIAPAAQSVAASGDVQNLVAAELTLRPAAPATPSSDQVAPQVQPQSANFAGAAVSADARRVADWVVSSGDTGGRPFIIVDKIRAQVFVFDSTGRLRGATLALMGAARGDDTVPGVGSQKLSAIRPEERITPAGRFVADLGHDLQHDILWIDYGAAVSLHRVVHGNPGDHRLARLATSSPLDKRITYGCINVPVKFYESIVLATFTGTSGVVYILPEVKTVAEVFPASDLVQPHQP